MSRVVPKSEYETIDKNELSNWGFFTEDYLVEILRGKYDLNEAREDILSFREDKKEIDDGQ